MATNKVEISVKDLEPVIRTLEGAKRHNERIKAAIEKIVCVEGDDEGVILVDPESHTEYDPVRHAIVYKNQYFSQLGESLVKLWRMVSFRCEECSKKLSDEEIGTRICDLCSAGVPCEQGENESR